MLRVVSRYEPETIIIPLSLPPTFGMMALLGGLFNGPLICCFYISGKGSRSLQPGLGTVVIASLRACQPCRAAVPPDAVQPSTLLVSDTIEHSTASYSRDGSAKQSKTTSTTRSAIMDSYVSRNIMGKENDA